MMQIDVGVQFESLGPMDSDFVDANAPEIMMALSQETVLDEEEIMKGFPVGPQADSGEGIMAPMNGHLIKIILPLAV